MKEKRLVPKRRFKGFNDEWEKLILAEATSKTGDGLHGTPKYKNDGTVFFINGNNLVNGKIIINDETKRVSEEEQSKDDKTLCENTILMSINGTIGNLAWYNGEKLMLGKSVAYIQVKDYDKRFIYSFLQTNNVYKYFINSLTGSTIKNLGLKAIRETTLYAPHKKEQQKIGQFFKHLDEMITLEQRKIDKTKALKSAYLAEMFPAEGERVPKRRFEGFKDDWKEQKLGEVVQIIMGQSPNSESYTDNPQDYILVQGNADMKNNRVFPRVWTTQVTKMADKGDLILSVRAPVGDIGKTDYDVVLGRGVASVKGNDFIYQLLIKMKKDNYWGNLSTGSTFDSINSNDIKEALVLIPEDEEQEKIGAFFKKLDDTISNHQQKLAKLKATKQAYLHEMFV